jgi:regulator of sirC expression with transglutaminase-like and TPR domain
MGEEFKGERQRARQAFITLIAGDEASIDLAQAALLIAAEEYPALNIERHMDRLEELAGQVRLRMENAGQTSTHSPATGDERLSILRAMNAVLFEQERFRGNRIDYYNPQNSFLNRVLERHLGIPLTLSLIYMEVGKRLGVPIEGIGLPFHFMVRCTLEEHDQLYIDPYEKGKFLREEDCRRQLAQIFKHESDFDPRWLEPLAPRQILTRLLNNLKHIYLHRQDFARALLACDRILLLDPAHASERRERGVLHFHLKQYARALRDLNAYIELAPAAEDSAEIRQQIKIIRQLLAMMN